MYDLALALDAAVHGDHARGQDERSDDLPDVL
jgi:hypothetical protein